MKTIKYKTKTIKLTIVILMTLLTSEEQLRAAGEILQPASATATVNNSRADRTINQVGFLDGASYVSTVTDFDTFTASARHGNANSGRWAAEIRFLPVEFTFDLGGSFP